ncbi:MAG: damage repair protein UvrX [Bacillales bacterium]|jgi:DNA polymerase V|nr:damage repair protein UvrX [Bacillales bacterium]
MFDYSHLPTQDILCIDMRSFYASCSCVMLNLDPLKTHLAVVGSLKHPGSVILAATPSLKREFGIKTASRFYEIPVDDRIHLVEPAMYTYLRISSEISRVFNRYAPKKNIYIYSVDEAFICLDGTKKIFGSAEEVAEKIIDEILREFGLACCIGIGPNMLLSKIALDVDAKKTTGTKVARWTYEDVPQKLWPISPLREMWGIGGQMQNHLNGLGIYSVGDLANYDLKKLEKKFGVMGKQLYYHAWGIDFSEIGGTVQPRSHSIGNGQMLMRDFYKIDEIKVAILEMCEEVARRARKRGVAGRTISLGLHYSKKSTHKGFYRSKTIERLTCVTLDIYEVCLELFKEFHVEGMAVRKIQIRLGNCETDTGVYQLDLFNEKRYKHRDIGFVMDSIRERYGKNALLRAVSATENATAKRRNALIGGHRA